jgi:hypothetical protein
MTGLRRWLGFAAMSLVSLVLAHDIIFLLAYGSRYEEELAHAGHGDAWLATALVVLTLAGGMLVAGLWHLRRLGIRARDLRTNGSATSLSALGVRAMARRLALEGVRLSGVTSALLVAQENIERRQVGQPLPGIGVLGSRDYPFGLVVVLVVAGGGGLVGTPLGGRGDRLTARPRATTVRWPRNSHPTPRGPALDGRRREPIMARSGALRAPPLLIDR